jgi:hypothetical protein
MNAPGIYHLPMKVAEVTRNERAIKVLPAKSLREPALCNVRAK